MKDIVTKEINIKTSASRDVESSTRFNETNSTKPNKNKVGDAGQMMNKSSK
jgi:hypothetical protein